MCIEAQVYGPSPPDRPSSATSQATSALGAPLGGHCGTGSASEVSVWPEPHPGAGTALASLPKLLRSRPGAVSPRLAGCGTPTREQEKPAVPEEILTPR